MSAAAARLIVAYRLFTENPIAAIEAARSGQLGFWIQGTVVYEDCFGKPSYDKVQICFWRQNHAESGTMALHADREGNEAN